MLAELHVAVEMRARQPGARRALTLHRLRADRATRRVFVRRQREPHIVPCEKGSWCGAIGRQRYIDRARGDLTPRCATIASRLNDRVTLDRGVLDGLSIRRVLQVDVEIGRASCRERV